MGTDLNSVVKQEGSKNKARRTSLPPAKSLPRRAGWTRQSARTTNSTKRGKLSVLCQAVRAGQEVQGANANNSRLPLQ